MNLGLNFNLVERLLACFIPIGNLAKFSIMCLLWTVGGNQRTHVHTWGHQSHTVGPRDIKTMSEFNHVTIPTTVLQGPGNFRMPLMEV